MTLGDQAPGLRSGCRIEIRTSTTDPAHPSSSQLIVTADPDSDGTWRLQHRDGRQIHVDSTVDLIERLVGIATDTSLAERWRTLAAQLPDDAERAQVLRFCAEELTRASRGACSSCGAATPPTFDDSPQASA
jgi:hypothetical protein